ncbi:hypothetical protein WJX81_003693 [Elliptochloris bilobata]|uniref:DNA-directed RNA polymerase I subunit rpa49 n=1 Tax=Elliptochloris bilobata TaxID=381761 RepID=A0AAW1RMS0_9CHLO
MKRKRESSLPENIAVEPAGRGIASAAGPYAAFFASGFRPNCGLPCSWEVHSSGDRQLLVARTDGVDFVGDSAWPATLGPPTCSYALGVLDKRAGVLRLAPAGGSGLVRLEPRVRGYEYGASPSVAPAPALDREGRVEQNRRLVDAFGSTRRRKQLAVKEAAAVRPDAVGGAEAVTALLAAANERAVAGGQTKEEVFSLAAEHRAIPPHHRHATAAADAYRLDELLPAAAWAALEGDVAELQRAVDDDLFCEDLRASGLWPALVLDRLPRLPRGSEGAARLRALAALGALLQLHQGPPVAREDGATGGLTVAAAKRRLPEKVLRPLLERFFSRHEAEAGGLQWSRSREQGRVLLLHVLIVALLADSGEMGAGQFDRVREALKIAPAELATMYREMGCVCTAAVGTASPMRQFRVVLLPAAAAAGEQGPKRLRDYFPKPKAPTLQRGRR